MVGYAPYTYYTYMQKYDVYGKPLQNQFEDLDGDGEITEGDRYMTGKSPAPKFYYGVNIKLSWKDWDFGLNGKNFIKTMLSVGQKYDTVRVVCDQVGTPTYTLDLSRLLVDMIETEKYGYYHATNDGGYISWYDFTCEIFRQAGYSTKVLPVTTEEYGLSKAARPFNSRLDKSKLVECGFTPLPTWQDALSRYLKELEN